MEDLLEKSNTVSGITTGSLDLGSLEWLEQLNANKPTPSLLGIPRELRDQIYTYVNLDLVFKRDIYVKWVHCSSIRFPYGPCQSLFLVNRQLCNEYRLIAYRNLKAIMELEPDLPLWRYDFTLMELVWPGQPSQNSRDSGNLPYMLERVVHLDVLLNTYNFKTFRRDTNAVFTVFDILAPMIPNVQTIRTADGRFSDFANNVISRQSQGNVPRASKVPESLLWLPLKQDNYSQRTVAPIDFAGQFNTEDVIFGTWATLYSREDSEKLRWKMEELEAAIPITGETALPEGLVRWV